MFRSLGENNGEMPLEPLWSKGIFLSAAASGTGMLYESTCLFCQRPEK